MRSDLFKHFQRLDLGYFQQRKMGDLVARATNDLSPVRQMLGPGISNLCNTTVAFTVTAIAMFSIDGQLTLYSLTVMPLISVFFFVGWARIRVRFRQVQDQFGEVSARAQENFSGIRVVKAYAQEQHELDGLQPVNEEYVRRSISLRAHRLAALARDVLPRRAGGRHSALARRHRRDRRAHHAGQTGAFNTYLASLAWPMIALGWTVNLLPAGRGLDELAFRRCALRCPPFAMAEATRPTPRRHEARSSSAQVSLAYQDVEVLHDINLLVPAGTSLGIVGATGVGQVAAWSMLLSRVFDVSAGAVLIDGVDVRQIPLVNLRAGHRLRAAGQLPLLRSQSRRTSASGYAQRTTSGNDTTPSTSRS